MINDPRDQATHFFIKGEKEATNITWKPIFTVHEVQLRQYQPGLFFCYAAVIVMKPGHNLYIHIYLFLKNNFHVISLGALND